MPPIYEYRCPHGHLFERHLPAADYKTPQTCECGQPGRRILSLPTVMVRGEVNYDSPIDGRPVTSARARRDDLARSGCIPYDPGMKQDYERRIVDGEKRLEQSVERTVEAEISKLPVRKREKLETELRSGADPAVVRETAPLATIVPLKR